MTDTPARLKGGYNDVEQAIRVLSEAFGLRATHGQSDANVQDPGGGSRKLRQVAEISRLLAGKGTRFRDTAYGLDAIHVAAVAQGPAGAEAIRRVSERRGCRLLLVEPVEGATWAWLAHRRRPDMDAIVDALRTLPLANTAIGLGEPGEGHSGWQRTHRQACRAMSVALNGGDPIVCYGSSMVVAAAHDDDLLISSLRERYIRPLEGNDGGRSARATLRAYFAASRHVSSAAAALGVKRHTVTNRLRAIEEHLVQRPRL
jgi:hypothetical protein